MTRRNAIIISILLLAVAAGVMLLFSQPRGKPALNTVDIRIPLSYTQPLVIATFDLDFSIRPLEARAAPMNTEAENRFRYIDAYPNTDVVQTKFTNKLKEDIILKSPGHPERFSYALDDTGLEARFDSEGNLHLYPLGADMSQTKFRIPAPYLIDANGEKSASRDVAMTFKNGILTLVPNPQWLSSHPYPITLDPTVEITVLNVNSVPTVGGPWEVRFTTIGTDTLVITGDPDNTVYGVNVELVSLKCGDRTEVTPNLTPKDTENNSYVFEGWSCDEEATWTVRVLKPGHHHQLFTFGDPGAGSGQTAHAYNDTVSNDWCGGLNTFSYRRKVTLDNSGESSALTGFPASVQLTQTGDLNNIDYSKTQNSGEDIRFCDQDNATRLEYEIENWNESATSTLWVKIPNLTAASSTEHIWMYYGNVSTTTAATTTGVWDENSKGVWHLKEDPTPASSPNGCDGGTKEVCDQTSNNNDGDSNGTMTSADQVVAKVDGGIDFDGTDDYVLVGDNASLDITGEVTITAWIKKNTINNAGSWDAVLMKGGSGIPEINYSMITYGIGSGETVGFYYYNATDQMLVGNTTGVQAGEWYHYAATYSDSQNDIRLYINGVQQAESVEFGNPQNNSITANNRDVGIGAQAVDGDNFRGLIDEVRISNVARSADWIKFEYCNMKFTCQTYGAEEYYPRPADVPGVKFR